MTNTELKQTVNTLYNIIKPFANRFAVLELSGTFDVEDVRSEIEKMDVSDFDRLGSQLQNIFDLAESINIDQLEAK